MEYVIITGASRGLGNSLAKTIVSKDITLILIARNIDKLISLKKELERKNNQKVLIYSFDLNDYEKVNVLMNDIIANFNLNDKLNITLINNAGSILPIKPIAYLKGEDIKSNLTVNVLSPIYIISQLIEFASQYEKKLKIINISSGAYKHPINSWALYCSSKAATQMFLEVAQSENNNNSFIKILSIDPGVMDTGMQESIRKTDSEKFNQKDIFIKLHMENKLRSVSLVAKIINENFVENWNVSSNFMKLDKFFEGK